LRPFNFHVNLDRPQAEQTDELRRRVADLMQTMASQETISNWCVYLLYLQIDIFLSLTFGRPLDAALSTTRYAAIADFVREYGKESDTAEGVADLQQCGDIAMNIGYDAFAMGEWNDYGDRRELARELVDGAAKDLGDLMHRSVSSAQRVVVRDTKERQRAEDPEAHAQLAIDVLMQSLR
jgi:hypothetical protein